MRRTHERAVLIVDDDDALRRSIVHVVREGLADRDVVVADASSGTECLAKLRERAWDVVLLDIRMPDSHGFEVLRAIKDGRDGVAVIMLSGLPSDQYATRAVRAGAFAYVQKERVSEDLVPLLNALLDAPTPAVA
jgi:two-component system, NarL family, invasion response regulator UvrY